MHRAENVGFYSAQGPVCKELENPVLKSKTQPGTNRSCGGQPAVTSMWDLFRTKQACLGGKEEGEPPAAYQSSPLYRSQTLLRVMVLAALPCPLDISTYSASFSVPRLHDNKVISPSDRSAT